MTTITKLIIHTYTLYLLGNYADNVINVEPHLKAGQHVDRSPRDEGRLFQEKELLYRDGSQQRTRQRNSHPARKRMGKGRYASLFHSKHFFSVQCVPTVEACSHIKEKK